MEPVHRWAADRRRRIEPNGVDPGIRLVAAAWSTATDGTSEHDANYWPASVQAGLNPGTWPPA
jgi:hypothetical protein